MTTTRHHTPYDYAASLHRVVDGDSMWLHLIASVDIGFHITGTFTTLQNVRLLGVDTPERNEPGYKEATEFTRQWLETNAPGLRARTTKSDSFGRYLADVYNPRHEQSLTAALLDNGHAVEWQAGRWQKITR